MTGALWNGKSSPWSSLSTAVRRHSRISVSCIAIFAIALSVLFLDTLRLIEEGRDGYSRYLKQYLPWGGTGDIDTHALRPDEGQKSGSPRPQHTWNANGLLTVNSEARHPIYDLMQRAESQWEEKLKHASTTIEEAVEEYQRRYNRPPPLGFDIWWDYTQKNNVQLPDEYNQIYRDLEPYWGVDPADLRHSQHDWEGHRDTWTIGKDNVDDPVVLVNMSLPEERVEDFISGGVVPQLELMGDLFELVPPFRATFSPHDNPTERVDWSWKAAALKAAKEGSFVKPGDILPQNSAGWAAMCPPGSPLHENPPPIGSQPIPQKEKTFIYDHQAITDICLHPQLLLLHGNFLPAGTDPIPFQFPAPQFSNCATSLHADIRAVSTYLTDVFLEDDYPWDEKDESRLVWRGSPTGMWLYEGPHISWRGSQRLRFVNLTSSDGPGAIHFLDPDSLPNDAVGEPVTVERKEMNDAMMDVGFSINSLGFNCEGVVCDIIEKELSHKDFMSAQAQGRYKYVFDVDGNGWSARFRRLMSMHSLVFKATVYAEWFTDRVQPWVHYVPVQMDYSDLYDSLLFFAGDLDGEGAHDYIAKKIGEQGREWVRRYWRREDMVAYTFRLYLEYARVMSIDRLNMNFKLPNE